jgi:hypothetical protein
MTPDTDDDSDPTTIEIEMRDDRTLLTIEGRRDASVIVRSAEGERIYLPPEDFDRKSGRTTAYSTTPYSTATESNDDDTVTSPYSTSVGETNTEDPEERYGRKTTPSGIRIVHPEPVTDVRVVR